MPDRRTDTDRTFGESDPAASVSNQNREENAPGADGGTEHRREDTGSGEGGAQERGSDSEQGGRVGGAGEGSQATGQPSNAG
jgi:hypothetical protein